MTRKEKIEALEKYFMDNFCEDPIDGTSFDIAVLDAIQMVKEHYSFDYHGEDI